MPGGRQSQGRAHHSKPCVLLWLHQWVKQPWWTDHVGPPPNGPCLHSHFFPDPLSFLQASERWQGIKKKYLPAPRWRTASMRPRHFVSENVIMHLCQWWSTSLVSLVEGDITLVSDTAHSSLKTRKQTAGFYYIIKSQKMMTSQISLLSFLRRFGPIEVVRPEEMCPLCSVFSWTPCTLP